MDWGRVKFFLGEVVRSFTRNKGMQATAIGTVTVTIVLIGSFLIAQASLANVGTQLMRQIEISAYLKDGLSSTTTKNLIAHVKADPRVLSVDYIPKKQGLAELAARTKGSLDLSILTENPLPDKLRIQVRDTAMIPAVAASVHALAGVADVKYGAKVVTRFLQLTNVLHRVALVILGLFVLVAGVIIANTIRLTVFARRREIAIMQLVGATDGAIRLPFIVEGVLSGLLGSLIAIVVLAIAHMLLWNRLASALPWVPLNGAAIRPLVLGAQLLGAGALIGAIASWLSVGRYLRT